MKASATSTGWPCRVSRDRRAQQRPFANSIWAQAISPRTSAGLRNNTLPSDWLPSRVRRRPMPVRLLRGRIERACTHTVLSLSSCTSRIQAYWPAFRPSCCRSSRCGIAQPSCSTRTRKRPCALRWRRVVSEPASFSHVRHGAGGASCQCRAAGYQHAGGRQSDRCLCMMARACRRVAE